MMPSEPDKKMDDLLRTYARKRREEAGEPLELHPATRRLLQAEAARLRPREATPQRTPWSWLALRWPRVAFAAGMFALLTIAVWTWIPDRGQTPSRSLVAKRDQNDRKDSEDKAATSAGVLERDGIAAPTAPLGGVGGQDKDLAWRPEAEALGRGARALDDVRLGTSLREAGAQTDVKLKEESAVSTVPLQQAPVGGPKSAEALATSGPTERQSLVRKLDAGAMAPRVAAGQPANRAESAVTNALSTVASLALAPPAAPAADAYAQLPWAAQASPATNPVPFFDALGVGAARQATVLNRSTVPAVSSPSTSAVLAFESLNYEVKGGRPDFGVESRDGATKPSLGDRSQGRVRETGAAAGAVLLAKEATPPATLPKQYRFQRLAEAEKAVVAKAAAGMSAPAGVLATFDFEQDGDRVRMTDSDGSVYSGRFITGAELGQAGFAELAEELNRPVPAGAEPGRRARTAESSTRYFATAGKASPTTNRVFRANGTNRTYGQLITIEASLSGADASSAGWSRGAAPAGATPSPSARPAAERYLRSPPPPPASAPAAASEIRETRRLVGRLLIGASNEVKFIAVPVAK